MWARHLNQEAHQKTFLEGNIFFQEAHQKRIHMIKIIFHMKLNQKFIKKKILLEVREIFEKIAYDSALQKILKKMVKIKNDRKIKTIVNRSR